MLLSLFFGFLLGALTIVAVEAFVLYHLIHRLTKKYEFKSQLVQQDVDPQQSLSFSYNKQGVIWILEPEKLAKVGAKDKLPKDQKNKKEIVEVTPVKKHAKIKDHSLIITNSNGSQVTIDLVDCMVLSVSASNLSSRKWAKRYPVKVEGKTSAVYNGSKTFYIYFETSWEKESWCKALRLATCDGKERVNWYAKLNKEFYNYLISLNAGYPSLKKHPFGFSAEPMDRTTKNDGSTSKVRGFLKKLAKKASKSGTDSKGNSVSASTREERKMGEKSRSAQDLVGLTGSVRYPLTEKTTSSSLDEDPVLSRSVSQSQASVTSDADFDDKFGVDEGTLCCNLLLSRLFFDAKRNDAIKSSIQERIQRTLLNLRTPSYIGGVNLTGLDLGTLPPNIHGMRVLPMDMNEVWAIELDLEYSGGLVLDVETRLEVREPGFEKSIINKGLESDSVGRATSDLLEGFQSLVSGEIVDEIDKKEEVENKHDETKFSKSSSWKSPYVSKWKSIVNSVANHVSQVPISLGIRIASVRGTLRIHIKPPPSDQLWFGFTSMPDIQFDLDSSVGDHKITSGHVAVILGNRFKAAIRDMLVLPNCEGVCVPWMLAEKDDWIPRKDAPYIWVKQEAVSDPAALELSNCQPEESETIVEEGRKSSDKQASGSNYLEEKDYENAKSLHQRNGHSEELSSSSKPSLSASSSTNQSTSSNRSLQDLKAPLLIKDESHNETYSYSRSESQEENQSPLSESMIRERQFGSFNEDPNPKKMGSRRARMMDLRNKVSEKFEEKKRHIEEKGRNIVEKMRGP
ncbi:hypothetical protein MKW98_027694 [Papaver atlanticum]|uniref:SMP-LTD domain-containing protein n=1 Tax=Papaver atlanticum TaxID=357466 RepID=A0AAD4T952_9MAGN|nr:hypothetical protein MKW98_027694 [Papaver atlanticum]